MSATLVQPSPLSTLRAILAAARKEWIIFLRYPSWVVAVLVWPILLPFGYIISARAFGGPDGAALREFERMTGTRDYVAFIIIGTLVWGWLNITLWDVGFQLRNEQMRGTLESNWLAPVPRIGLLLGSSLAKLAISLGFLAISITEFWLLFGVRVVQGNPGLQVVIVLLLIPSIYGIGIGFASLVLRFKEANAMVFLVRGVFMLFCGITFPVAVLPVWMQPVAAALPLTYATAALRGASLAGASWQALWPELRALALFALVLPLAGGAAFYWMERRARRTGDLGNY
jgi:ABC-2 type transport system permease protein